MRVSARVVGRCVPPLVVAVVAWAALCGLASAQDKQVSGSDREDAGPASAAAPIVVLVMDPLAAPLSCPCVQGYAQRDYERLAAWLRERLRRPVELHFDESLPRALNELTGGRADLVIGKDSVVRHDAAKTGREFHRVALLTGKDGDTTQTGLIVVAATDPAQSVSDLRDYRVIFGPAESIEKHAAALDLLREHGVAPPKEIETRQGCDEGATLILELPPDERGAAVISSYARPLLEGCGTVPKGALRVVGRTRDLPFVGAFLSADLDAETSADLTDALRGVSNDVELMQALETKRGFIIGPDEPPPLTAGQVGWNGWRGPARDGRVAWLPERLAASPNIVWRKPTTRPGVGGLAATDRWVIVSDRDIDDRSDVFRCLDANTGGQRWAIRYRAQGRLDYGNSPRATPLIDGDRAYLQGAFGHLICCRLDDGRVLWKRDLRRDFEADEELVWGAASSPLLVDGRLIVNPGGPRASLVALDALTGEIAWQSPGEPPAFASLVLATLGGRRQVVGYDQDSLGGWDPLNGERLWRMTPAVEGDFNVPTPIVDGDSLLVASENNGTRRFQFSADGRIDARPTAENGDLAPDAHTPVLVGRRLLGLWGGLYALNVDDGLGVVWRADDTAYSGYGSIIADDRRALVLSQDGQLLLFDALVDEYLPLGRYELFTGDAGVYSHPALVGTRLYVRGSQEVLCVELGPRD